jgi:hypothetical protein
MRVHSNKVWAVVVVAVCTSLTACRHETSTGTNEAVNANRDAAKDVYVYGYPLVLMDVTRAKMSNVPSPSGNVAPVGQFASVRAFPDATFTDVVSPNADTLYSIAWLDLKQQPTVLSVPDTHGRYYLMEMVDGWTKVFASPGKRTTGTGKADYAVTGPGWSGTLPAGVKELKSPTALVWVIGRTQTNGKADYAAVHAIQDGFKLTPLSEWGKAYTPPKDVRVDPKVDMKTPPVELVASMDAATFFNRLAMLMKNNPPAAADGPMVAKLASIGIVPGQPFDLNKNGSDAGKVISDGVDDGKKRVLELGPNPGIGKSENGWMLMTSGVGDFGTNYDARAGVAVFGLGGNLVADAFYPVARVDGDGQLLNGANKYVLHFDKGQTPPVNAFWSLTMYNAKQGFVANPINRYAIGDRDKLKFNTDGSLDIYVRHDSPGKDKESNWLPADADSFNVVMRMYWPKETAFNGTWSPPPIKKAS